MKGAKRMQDAEVKALRRLALQIAAQLPAERDEAMVVIETLKALQDVIHAGTDEQGADIVRTLKIIA